MEVTDSRRLEFNFNTQQPNIGMRPQFCKVMGMLPITFALVKTRTFSFGERKI